MAFTFWFFYKKEKEIWIFVLFWHLKEQSPMQFLISRDLTFNVSPGCEGNVSSVACAHLHSFPKLKSSQIPMGPKCFCFHFVYQGSLKFIFAKLFSMNYLPQQTKKNPTNLGQIVIIYPSLTGSYDNIWPKFSGWESNWILLTLVYRIDVQDEINMQVEKFFKKH